MSEAFFAPCPRGLEGLLAAELGRLGAARVDPTDGGIGFAGDFALAARANLESRIASRVLWRVGEGEGGDERSLYETVHALPWRRWFSVDRTIRVDVTAIASPLKSLDFATLKVKDAVCDRFRADVGRRPSVDRARPGVRIHVFLERARATLYLDTSGEALFKRGYRRGAVEAPLRENLAAGIVLLSGWEPSHALLDPMCGSATLLAEAALIGLDRAPGIARHFGFQRLTWFDAEAWERMRREAKARGGARSPLRLFGSDVSESALEAARENLTALGVARQVRLERCDALERAAPAPEGVLVANLPYGLRIDDTERLAAFYPRLGDALKQRFAGWRASLLSADRRLPDLIGLKLRRRVPLYNGAIECRLYQLEIVKGRPSR